MSDTPNRSPEDFADEANQPQQGFFGEFWYFLRTNKKWWLTPILLVLLLVCGLVVMSSTGAAPFIYTLF